MIILDGAGSKKSSYKLSSASGDAPDGIRVVIDPTKIKRGYLDVTLKSMGEALKKHWPELA